jgi:hypothetical protein
VEFLCPSVVSFYAEKQSERGCKSSRHSSTMRRLKKQVETDAGIEVIKVQLSRHSFALHSGSS